MIVELFELTGFDIAKINANFRAIQDILSPPWEVSGDA